MDAWERNDVETVMEMLAEDASFAMPPLASWFGGEESIRIFLAGWPLSGDVALAADPARANGQPALAFYAWDEDERRYLPFALNVLTFRGELISDVTAFVARATDIPERRVVRALGGRAHRPAPPVRDLRELRPPRAPTTER